jgi:hypothetical protein
MLQGAEGFQERLLNYCACGPQTEAGEVSEQPFSAEAATSGLALGEEAMTKDREKSGAKAFGGQLGLPGRRSVGLG